MASSWVPEPLEGRFLPSTITVTSLDDQGRGTLRAAIVRANKDKAPDTIRFARALTGKITLSSSLPDLSTRITLTGPGPSRMTVAGSTFQVVVGAKVSISGLTITGGNSGISNSGTLAIADCSITGNTATDGGGVSNSGELTVTNSSIRANSATDTDGKGGEGGGIYNSGNLTLVDALISDNSAKNGGGISNTGLLVITRSTLSHNSTVTKTGDGGAIFNSGVSTIENSSLSDNSAKNGGGISNTGTMTTINCTILRNDAGRDLLGDGGGIYSKGAMTVLNSSISGNLGDSGGGVYSKGIMIVTTSSISENSAFHGGGIYNGGILTVTNSTINGNSNAIGGYGGGFLNFGSLTVANSMISRNGSYLGGGIYSEAPLAVTQSTLSDNSAEHGGGIFSYGELAVTDCSILRNTVNDEGGGHGGGIFSYATLTVTSSIISGNSAPKGGGISTVNGPSTVTNSTISSNSARGNELDNGIGGGGFFVSGILTLRNSTISKNSTLGNSGGGIYFYSGEINAEMNVFADNDGSSILDRPLEPESRTQFRSLGHNVFTDNPSETLAPTDLVNTDPMLGPLADNGGPTFTQALLPGSPAIDAGVAIAGVLTDQRGVQRPQGAAPDIGAFEVGRLRVAPTVVGLRLVGVNRRPPTLVLSFSLPLEPTTAADVRNYTLIAVKPNGRVAPGTLPILINIPTYDPTTLAVTLKPRTRIRPRGYYRLTVNGSSPSGVAGADGTLLGGAGGQSGSNYVAIVHGLSPATAQ